MLTSGSRLSQRGIERSASEDRDEGRQEWDVVLAERRELAVATTVAKSRSEIPLVLQIPRAARCHHQRYPHVLAPAHWVVVDSQEGPWDRGGLDGQSAALPPGTPATSHTDPFSAEPRG